MRPFALFALLALPVQAQRAPLPCPTHDCFQLQSPCDTPVCIYGLQGTVEAVRTRGPKVDVKATLTAFLKAHPDTALLLAGQEDGRLGLWAYQGLESRSVTSRFPFSDFAAYAKGAAAGDAGLATLLLPEPIQTRLLGAKALVIVPLPGFPNLDFAALKPEGWAQPLGQRMKVRVIGNLEDLNGQ